MIYDGTESMKILRLIVVASLLTTGICLGAHAQTAPGSAAPRPAAPPTANAERESIENLSRAVTHYSYSGPARVELGDQAVVRLSEPMFLLTDLDTSLKVLKLQQIPVPEHLLAVVHAPTETDMQSWGTVEFVPSGSIDADDMQAWSATDMLTSLQDTVARENKEHPEHPMTVRSWIQPPTYDAATHQVTWAALIIPQASPKDSGGVVTYNGVAFGRDGYIRISLVSTVERARVAEALITDFLHGLTFNPGKGYDVLAPKAREGNALARVLRMDDFHRAPIKLPSMFADKLVPLVGGGIALVAALALGIYALRYRRREARRW
jgi:uncharacterized membrane-anchored protein